MQPAICWCMFLSWNVDQVYFCPATPAAEGVAFCPASIPFQTSGREFSSKKEARLWMYRCPGIFLICLILHVILYLVICSQLRMHPDIVELIFLSFADIIVIESINVLHWFHGTLILAVATWSLLVEVRFFFPNWFFFPGSIFFSLVNELYELSYLVKALRDIQFSQIAGGSCQRFLGSA